MKRQTSSAALAALGILLVGAATAAAQDPAPPQARLRLAISGDAGKGRASFEGTLSLERFAARGDRVVAVGMVSGTVTGKDGRAIGTGVVGRVELPVQVGPGSSTASSSGIGIQQVACDVLHLEIGAINFDLLGVQVTTMPIAIDLTAQGDGTDVLGQLICTVLETVGNVIGLVDVLNSLLGLLTGLLGGLLGGIGGIVPTP